MQTKALSLGCDSGLLLHSTLSSLVGSAPAFTSGCLFCRWFSYLPRLCLLLSPFKCPQRWVFNSSSQLWNPDSPPWQAIASAPSFISLTSPSLSRPFPIPPPPTARILQEGRLLPDNAKAPGGENSQGWALSVQSGFSVRGLTEKVLDHKLDGDAAILLLRPFSFGTLMHSLSRWFDVDLKKTSGLGQDSRTTGPVHGSAVDSVSFFLFLF